MTVFNPRISVSETKVAMQTGLLLSILFFIAYLPSLDFGFFVDDDVYVGLRNRVLPMIDSSTLWRLAIAKANEWEYLPFRDLSYWLDMRFLGYEPMAFHASNLIWYGVCCCGVFQFTKKFFHLHTGATLDRTKYFASLATLLFVVHPAHVEAVVWISGRKDILATAFFTYAGSCYLHAIERGWSLKGLAISCVLCLMALFSKSVAVFCVPILSLMALSFGRVAKADVPRFNFWLFVLSPLLLSFIAANVHLQVAQQTGIAIANSPGVLTALERASRILASLVGILLLPYKLRLVYDVYALGWWHWIVS